MSTRVVAACVQISARPDIAASLEQIGPLIHEARQRGAQLITLPENAPLMVCSAAKRRACAEPEADHPAVAFFAKAARDTGAWILAGSVHVPAGPNHVFNRSLLFDPEGKIVARYDKIHLFDATVGDEEPYQESTYVMPGERAVVAETPWGKIGLTICYDLRFPQLYRALAKAGASIITAPAAYVVPTGKLHWHVLVRARAIENHAFVIAPAQCGIHDGGRRTYGHSLIVAPSGEILAEAGETPGIIIAELDLSKVAEARSKLPNLKHDRDFKAPV